MSGTNKRFVIPVYQRNYDWKKEQCKQLYEDLKKIIMNKRERHFFGSIVSVYNPDGSNEEFLIIDGQQRITTVSLLFLALHNLIKDCSLVPRDQLLPQKIYEEYLVDRFQEGEQKIKLKSIKEDREAFNSLFSSQTDQIPDSNVTINYNFFLNEIRNEKDLTPDELFLAICKLEIIEIKLNISDGDDPQLIFQSLNSTGLDLTEGDKIRNFMLMNLPAGLQQEYYEKYWNKLEKFTNFETGLFIRDYLSVKQGVIPAINKTYATFKEYFEENSLERGATLAELLDYASRYKLLLNGGFGDKRLDGAILRLNRLETAVLRPFFMEVIRLYESGILSKNDLAKIFEITENYIFRRSICNLPSNALNKIFSTLHGEILAYDGSDSNYLAKFSYSLLSRQGKGRFPKDDEFKAALSSADIFLTRSKTRQYILERLENHATREENDIYAHFDDGTYSIEHIMPQTLTVEWRTHLGEDYERVHDFWKHKLANLTITAYNSKYSNASFIKKRDMEDGFKDSNIKLNKYIAELGQWNEEELKARNNHLLEKALNVWKMPTTDFMPKLPEYEVFSLDEAPEPTNLIIKKFSYGDIEQPVESWIEMFLQIILILHNSNPAVLYGLATNKDENPDLANSFSLNKAGDKKYGEIDSNLYVNKHLNNTTKLNLLRKIFKLFGADSEDLVFYVEKPKPGQEENKASAA